MIDIYQSVSPPTPLSGVTRIADLSSSVSVVLPTGAKGIMVQPFSQSVHFRTGKGEITAVTTDFVLLVADGFRYIPLMEGTTIAFLQTAGSATLTYQIFS